MKINLITYSRTRNYGGILQAYGLYRYLELADNEVKFIDYIPARCNIDDRTVFVNETTAKSKVWGINSITKWLFATLRYPAIKETFQPFLNFMNSRANFTKPYYSEEELEKDVPEADIYITGSDQVWNSQFTRNQKLDLPFYLPFVNQGKKISYASSFGKDNIPEKDVERVKTFIRKYDAVSVREVSGQNLLKKLNIAAEIVVDPTILCPVDEWELIVNHQLDDKYILLYQVTFNKGIYNMARSVAEKIGKKLIVISLDCKDKKNVKDGLLVAPSIEDWLSYIKYADGVITDSFHASVFSILFRTQFVVSSGTRKGMSSRISNLLESVELQQRGIDSFDVNEVFTMMTKPVDWDNAFNCLTKLRVHSVIWLKKALE